MATDKLWQKPYELDAYIESFTVGRDRELDLPLAPYDILGSLAHARMLSEVGLLSAEELAALQPVLIRLYREAVAGDFTIEPGVEDVHSQVELQLTRELGDTGKKIHSGRSRNDQVLLDLRLYLRSRVAGLVRDLAGLVEQLLDLSDRHQDDLLPGYTHLQIGMVSSFGLWFGAYAESLIDDLRHWLAVYQIIDQNPLGSAAGYGSSFPLDRDRTTELLGFGDLAVNVIHAQLGRGKTELFVAYALGGTGHTLGKMAMDVGLYTSQNFGFVKLPDELTTGSSIMPHKKNPDVFELLRGRCNLLVGLAPQIAQLTGNLPSGYHRDFQLLKESLFPALDHLAACIDMARYATGRLEIQPNLLDNPRYDLLYSVEAVNEQVAAGVPFRDAYHAVAADIEAGTFTPPRVLKHTHVGSLGNLGNDRIRAKLAGVMGRFGLERAEEAAKKLID